MESPSDYLEQIQAPRELVLNQVSTARIITNPSMNLGKKYENGTESTSQTPQIRQLYNN